MRLTVIQSDANSTPSPGPLVIWTSCCSMPTLPVPTDNVDDAINRVEARILALGEREIKSRTIGELVMRELKKLDKVAYVRFASVYRSFEDIDEFKTLVDEVRR